MRPVTTEPLEVRVTVEPPAIGGWLPESAEPFPGGEWTVVANPGETLTAIIDRTAGRALEDVVRAAGIPADAHVRAIFLRASETGAVYELGETPVLDSDGRLRAAPGSGTPLGDLIRAHDVGLLAGDPRDMVVRPQPPTAGVGGAGWDTFVDALEVLWNVAGDLGKIAEAGAGAKLALHLFRKAGDVLSRHANSLDEAGIRPTELRRFLALRAWTTHELATALAITDAEVYDLMPGLGFEEWADGLWHPASNPKAVEVAVDLVQLASSYEAATRDHEQLAARYREYIRNLTD